MLCAQIVSCQIQWLSEPWAGLALVELEHLAIVPLPRLWLTFGRLWLTLDRLLQPVTSGGIVQLAARVAGQDLAVGGGLYQA